MKIECIKKEKGVFIPEGYDKGEYEGLVVRRFVRLKNGAMYYAPFYYDFIVKIEGVTFYVNFRADKKSELLLYEEHSGGCSYKSSFSGIIRSSEKAFLKSLVEALEDKCLKTGTSLPHVIERYRIMVLNEMELWKIVTNVM